MVGMYILNVLVSIDQLINTIAGGYPDETISSRLAKLNRKGNKIGIIGCAVLDKFDKNHCERTIELDEGIIEVNKAIDELDKAITELDKSIK